MICVKGIAWLNFKNVITSQGGAPVEDAIAGLSPVDQAIFSKPISAVSWLNFGAVMRLIVQYNKGSLPALKEGSTWAARENLKKIYRAFLSLTSPRFICNKIQ